MSWSARRSSQQTRRQVSAYKTVSSDRSLPDKSRLDKSLPDKSRAQVATVSLPPNRAGQPGSSILHGIQGSAMTLPVSRPPSQTADRRRSLPASARDPAGSSPLTSHEACQKEKASLLAREKQLKEQLQQLQKELAELTAVVTEKEEVIHRLTAENQALEQREAWRGEEAERRERVGEQLRSQQGDFTQQLQLLRKEMEEKMAAKDQEIADREQALKTFQSQMAQRLKEASLGRQQQLAELGEEVSRLREESQSLRSRLVSLTTARPAPPSQECGKCGEATKRAERLAVTLKEREVTITQLKSLCAKFETQLSQQDVLLKQWADSKGHSVQLPPR